MNSNYPNVLDFFDDDYCPFCLDPDCYGECERDDEERNEDDKFDFYGMDEKTS